MLVSSLSDWDAFSQVVTEIAVHTDVLLCLSEVSLVFPLTLFNVLAPFFYVQIRMDIRGL